MVPGILGLNKQLISFLLISCPFMSIFMLWIQKSTII